MKTFRSTFIGQWLLFTSIFLAIPYVITGLWVIGGSFIVWDLTFVHAAAQIFDPVFSPTMMLYARAVTLVSACIAFVRTSTTFMEWLMHV